MLGNGKKKNTVSNNFINFTFEKLESEVNWSSIMLLVKFLLALICQRQIRRDLKR